MRELILERGQREAIEVVIVAPEVGAPHHAYNLISE
jgi:hypothetical protein